MPTEAFLPYYAHRVKECAVYTVRLVKTIWDIWQLKRESDRPENENYMDPSITPVPEIKPPPPRVASLESKAAKKAPVSKPV